MYKFNRNYQYIVRDIIFLAMMILVAVAIMSISATSTRTILACCAITLLYMSLAMKFLPEDFNYSVKVREDLLVFEYNEIDRRVLKKPFTIRVTQRYIILSDGNTTISVPYAKEVIKFLEALNKWGALKKHGATNSKEFCRPMLFSLFSLLHYYFKQCYDFDKNSIIKLSIYFFCIFYYFTSIL